MTSGSQRMRNSDQYAKTRVSGIPFRAYSDWNGTDIKVSAAPGFLSSSLEVTVRKKYVNPLGHLLELLGIGQRQKHTASTRDSITNPTEFIRNIDTIYDVGSGLWDSAGSSKQKGGSGLADGGT